jgi:hypothetical protein
LSKAGDFFNGQEMRFSEGEINLTKYVYKKGDAGIWGDVTSEAMYLNDGYSSDNYIEKIAKLGEKIK